MGSRKIVLVLTAGFSFLNTGIFWREAKTKRLFSQCMPDGHNYLQQTAKLTRSLSRKVCNGQNQSFEKVVL
jgi:hypothetical protein